MTVLANETEVYRRVADLSEATLAPVHARDIAQWVVTEYLAAVAELAQRTGRVGGSSTWERLGLSGATLTMPFRTIEECAAAVTFLAADKHGHHFAVVHEGCSIVCSEMAINCLNDHWRAEQEEAEQRERRRGPDLGDDPDGDIEGADYPPFP